MNNTKTAELVTAENKVLRDTYRLLSMNLLTSSLASFVSMSMGIPPINVFIMLGVYFVLLYLVTKNEDNAFGVVATFLFTGWLGFTLGPYINYYLSLPNGGNIVTNALLGTAIIFVSLSAWVTIRKTNVMGWGSFLSVSILSAFILGIVNMLFFQSGIFALLLSTVFMVLSGAIIMWQTSAIIHGGERNYIRATTTLFVSIYNIFSTLLQIFGIMGSDD
ncbi:MAG: BAX inhibitor protein [Chloroflexi bacterium]|nr:BAX inhibitor protein [Chloroflexota bacterium]|tara:strand:- start:72905 stop:73561 length:657 start_codon:yes stop_codon:yes gene_type:complete